MLTSLRYEPATSSLRPQVRVRDPARNSAPATLRPQVCTHKPALRARDIESSHTSRGLRPLLRDAVRRRSAPRGGFCVDARPVRTGRLHSAPRRSSFGLPSGNSQPKCRIFRSAPHIGKLPFATALSPILRRIYTGSTPLSASVPSKAEVLRATQPCKTSLHTRGLWGSSASRLPSVPVSWPPGSRASLAPRPLWHPGTLAPSLPVLGSPAPQSPGTPVSRPRTAPVPSTPVSRRSWLPAPGFAFLRFRGL